MVTELDKLERAKSYIDKMSEGINPITDEKVSESETICNERISRCLAYVSEIIHKAITEEKEKQAENRRKQIKYFSSIATKKSRFSISEEQLAKLHPRTEECRVSDITKDINAVISGNEVASMQASWINEWLLYSGLVEVCENGSDKVANEAGEAIGIRKEIRQSIERGDYYINIFSPQAQQFIYDNIDAIVSFHYEKQ